MIMDDWLFAQRGIHQTCIPSLPFMLNVITLEAMQVLHAMFVEVRSHVVNSLILSLEKFTVYTAKHSYDKMPQLDYSPIHTQSKFI